MRRSRHPFVRLIVVAAVIVLTVIIVKNYWPASKPADTQPAEKDRPGQNGRTPTTRGTLPPPVHLTIVKTTPADRATALTLLERGLGLHRQGKLLAARATLSDALNTSALPEKQADTARAKLAELAKKTIFSRKVVKGDPCTFWYTFQSGDVPVRVERKLRLRVPTQLMLKVNGITDATRIQAGQTLKMIKGPFHAVVSKSRFVMDIFLEDPKTGRRIFVKRFRVGVGMDGSTPTGHWRVVHGGKMDKAEWTPPASSNLARKKISWGQPGYPLGTKGYWISMEGIENKGNPYTREDGFGIHGTHDPTSIGKASSLGCIRLKDDDIEMLFAMLYEKWSTVAVLP